MEQLLTVPEVAEILRVEQSTVRRWVNQNTLPCVFLPMTDKKENRKYRIRRSDLDTILSPEQAGQR